MRVTASPGWLMGGMRPAMPPPCKHAARTTPSGRRDRAGLRATRPTRMAAIPSLSRAETGLSHRAGVRALEDGRTQVPIVRQAPTETIRCGGRQGRKALCCGYSSGVVRAVARWRSSVARGTADARRTPSASSAFSSYFRNNAWGGGARWPASRVVLACPALAVRWREMGVGVRAKMKANASSRPRRSMLVAVRSDRVAAAAVVHRRVAVRVHLR